MSGTFDESRKTQLKGRAQRMCALRRFLPEQQQVHYFEYHAVVPPDTLTVLDTIQAAQDPRMLQNMSTLDLLSPELQEQLEEQLRGWSTYTEIISTFAYSMKASMESRGLHEQRDQTQLWDSLAAIVSQSPERLDAASSEEPNYGLKSTQAASRRRSKSPSSRAARNARSKSPLRQRAARKPPSSSATN